MIENRPLDVPLTPLGSHGWLFAHPSDADIAWAKSVQAQHDADGVRNRWDPGAERDWRWDGRLGEAAFSRWAMDADLPCRWFGGLRDPDFQAGHWRIGVKTAHRPGTFLPHYDVKVLRNVVEHDRESLFAFFAYESGANRLLFLGAISRRLFFIRATEKREGDTLSGGVPVETPIHVLQARELSLTPAGLLEVLNASVPEAATT